LKKGLDIDDVLYQSPAGSIRVVDVLYGYSVEIERSGQHFLAHKTRFAQKLLQDAIRKARFTLVYSRKGNLEIDAVAFKGSPDQLTRALFGLPEGWPRPSF
jgi:hypothetical protein